MAPKSAAIPLTDMLCTDKPDAPPKYPTFKVTGFIHLDGVRFSQDAASTATVGDVQDGLGFRRARVAATGNLAEHITYIMEFDYADFQARFVDVWANFAQVPVLGNIRIGRWRQPFGMAELTGIRELPFLERELGFAYAPFRQTGVGAFNHSEDERLTWAASVYRFNTDFFGNVVGDNGGYGTAGRVTYLPYYEDDHHLVHVGADYSYEDPSMDSLIVASPPEVFVGQSLGGPNPAPILGTPPFVNTGAIPTRSVNLFNLEAAAVMGSFAIQSEARWAMVSQINGPTRTLPAVYVQARYMLTGEEYTYNKANAVIGRIKPRHPVDLRCGSWGAWEIAARYSYIDLNGTLGTGPGRSLNDTTLGVNWYITDLTKIQFNYIHAFLNDPVIGRSNTDIFAMRFQFDF